MFSIRQILYHEIMAIWYYELTIVRWRGYANLSNTKQYQARSKAKRGIAMLSLVASQRPGKCTAVVIAIVTSSMTFLSLDISRWLRKI